MERDYPKLNHKATIPTNPCVIGALVEMKAVVVRGTTKPGIVLIASARQLELFGSQDPFN